MAQHQECNCRAMHPDLNLISRCPAGKPSLAFDRRMYAVKFHDKETRKIPK